MANKKPNYQILQCSGLTKHSKRCLNKSIPGEIYCALHHPDLSKLVALQDSNRTTQNVKPIKTIADVIKLQSKILTQLGAKDNLGAKELQAFSSITASFVKNLAEYENLPRLDQLEAITKHLT